MIIVEIPDPPAENRMMTTRAAPPAPPQSSGIPPLEQGDRLTRDEFERRFEAMPHIKKAELIEGVVNMAPPALRWDYHATPHAKLITWLGTYEAATPGVRTGDNASVRLDLDNEPQPDVILMIEPTAGGQATISADNYVEGAPELVAEVSSSTVSIDLNDKLRAYRRNGVREYIVWRVQDRAIDWFTLSGSEYVPLTPDGSGILKNAIFPGLWLDPAAMLREDLAQVLRSLQQGLSTPAHDSFANALAAKRSACDG
jgi:Uma2 family endonuclease